MNDKQRRCQWATDQIAHHQAKIAELKRFLRLLEKSDEAVSPPNGGQPARRGRKRSLPDIIADVLGNAGERGMSVTDVTVAVTQAGYEPKGRTKVGTAVASELARQAGRGLRGIVRIGDGRYARRLEEET